MQIRAIRAALRGLGYRAYSDLTPAGIRVMIFHPDGPTKDGQRLFVDGLPPIDDAFGLDFVKHIDRVYKRVEAEARKDEVEKP